MSTESDGTDEAGRVPTGTESVSGFRRRELLIGGGAIAGAALFTRFESNKTFIEDLLRAAGPTPSFTASLLRPEDMLAIDVEFYRASTYVNSDESLHVYPYADKVVQYDEFFMVAVFGAQAVAEEPLQTKESLLTKPTPAQLSGPSRLAFAVRGELRLDDESLLDWVTLTPQSGTTTRGGSPRPDRRMLLVPVAQPKKGRPKDAKPQKPSPIETAVEAPFKMLLSPARPSAGEQFWRNSGTPVTHDERTELWHTRLVNLKSVNATTPQTESIIRAVWTPGWGGKNPDYTSNAAPEPFPDRPMTLTPRRRSEIVSLSSDLKNVDTRYGYSRLLVLSALGASHNVRFDFPNVKGDPYGVTHWSNRGTLGRDHYVKVVETGWLFPFGHEAALIDISERQIDTKGANGIAVVRKRQYLVLKQKTVGYSSNAFPFSSVSVVEDTSPLLDETQKSEVPGVSGAAFWPRVNGSDYLWTLTALDAEGVRVEFQAPLLWVRDSTATGKTSSAAARRTKIRDYYNSEQRKPQRARPLGGQSIAYAPSIPGKARQTAFATDVFELSAITATESFTPRFLPRFRGATIATPAIAALGPNARLDVKLSQAYINSGFDPAKNAAQAYLQTAKKVAIDYTKDAGAAATGALGAPNMELSALSRTLGPLGGTLKNGTLPSFKPADFLKGAKFLGVEFTDVLPKEVPFPKPDTSGYEAAAAKVPRTLTETVYDAASGNLENKIPKEIRTEFTWEPELKTNAVFIANGPGGSPNATMLLRNVTVVPVTAQGPGKARSDTTGEIKNFGLSLFGEPGSSSAFLVVYFNRFEFRSRNEQKPDIHVDVRDVQFAGPLSFVNDLRQLMSSVGGGAGLTTDITPSGVVAGYGVDFPTITTGILTIANISFGAQIELPFNGDPVTTRFNFCEPKRPFLLTYTIFGGGGYANIAINSKNVEELTVSLEFGAAAAINLGVASGSVQIMAGIVIKVADSNAILTGFVRLRGELDILGIISVSLEFNLSLTYDTGTGEARGRATLTVEVEVFCFSKSVSVTVEKKFSAGGGLLRARESEDGSNEALKAGSNPPAPIGFTDLYSTQDWDTYRAAFAAEAF